MKIIAITFGVILLFSCTNAQKKTEIIWDNWGVPHVYANNETEMYYAFGWAQMHNHANLILKLYAQSRGRAAEYFGEEYLNSDKQIHLFNLVDSAESHYKKNSGEEMRYLDAFVNGINDFAKAHPDEIDDRVKPVLPISATDVLAHIKRVVCLGFIGGNDIRNSIREIEPGSNAYAIAPSKSASSNAMLVINPHLPWNDLYLFFEAQLTAPEFNTYGVSLVGMPTLLIAFNQNLGWTHTVNTIDASDRYELALQDGGYLLDGKIELFEEKRVSLKVLKEDGSTEQQEIELKYSKHGPITAEKGDTAYAVRIAGLENDLFNVQYHRMSKAKNLKEFEDALKMMQNPMFNVIYADKVGNILYLFNGNVPQRSEGNWDFWNRTVDGTQSKYIWNKYHDYDDLPKLINPSTGFVQNANDPPWTATYPLLFDPEDYPSYFSPKERPITLRPQRAINLVKDDASISFEELVDYKLNTGMESADRFLDDLLAAVEQYPDSVAEEAASVLKQWDKATNTYSRGAVLFGKWFDKLNSGMFAIPWNPKMPASTPDGLNNPQQAVELLITAANEVKEVYDSINVAWGDVYRLKVGEYEFPANGGPDQYGIFRTMYYHHNNENNKNYAYHGETFVAVIEFGKTLKAEVLLSYGNATQPHSAYIGDQLQFLSEKKMRRVLFSKKDVLLNKQKIERL